MAKQLSPIIVSIATSLIVCGLLLGLYERRNNQRVERTAETSAISLYQNQISGCERGNQVRLIIHELLVAAEEARRTPPIEPGDVRAANKYARLDNRIWPIPTCSSLIARP